MFLNHLMILFWKIRDYSTVNRCLELFIRLKNKQDLSLISLLRSLVWGDFSLLVHFAAMLLCFN
jgi:hypothetical protein